MNQCEQLTYALYIRGFMIAICGESEDEIQATLRMDKKDEIAYAKELLVKHGYFSIENDVVANVQMDNAIREIERYFRSLREVVDNGEDLKAKDYNEIKDVVETTAASATTGKNGAALNKTFLNLLTNPEIIGCLVTLRIAIISSTGVLDGVVKNTSSWLKKILR